MESTWHILFVSGIILLVLEVFFPWMILFPIGLALIMTTPVMWFTDQSKVQVACLIIFSLFNIVILRRWVSLKRAMRAPDSALDYLIGKEALVVQNVDPKRRIGSVRFQNKTWQAISQMAEPLSTGTKVVIMNIDDTKLIVRAKND